MIPMSYFELPIKDQQYIKSYTQYGLTACVLFSEKNYHPWILENFIQIKSFPVVSKNGNSLKYGMDNCVINDPTQMNFSPVLTITKTDWKTIDDPVAYIKNSIDNGTYIYAELNEYYLSEKATYQKTTKIKPNLIYGYDVKKNCFYGVGFAKDSLFKKIELKIDEIPRACSISECTGEPDRPAIYAFNLKKNPMPEAYDFNVQSFKKIIHQFINPIHTDEWVYGTGIYDVIFANLKNPEISGRFIRYNVPHMLSEHKAMFNLALNYIVNNNGLRKSFEDICNEYAHVSKLFEDIRLFFMDRALKEGPPAGIARKETIEEFNKLLSHASDTEYKVLSKIYDRLDNA